MWNCWRKGNLQRSVWADGWKMQTTVEKRMGWPKWRLLKGQGGSQEAFPVCLGYMIFSVKIKKAPGKLGQDSHFGWAEPDSGEVPKPRLIQLTPCADRRHTQPLSRSKQTPDRARGDREDGQGRKACSADISSTFFLSFYSFSSKEMWTQTSESF